MWRDVGYAAGVVGILLLLLGALLSLISPGDRVTRGQSAVAFAYLAEVPLARVESQRSVTIPVMILDTPRVAEYSTRVGSAGLHDHGGLKAEEFFLLLVRRRFEY